MLYKRLFKTFPSIEIFADEQGSEEFQRSFVNYIRERHMPDLFWTYDFTTCKSSENVLVQIADVIAGSLARKIDPNKKCDKSDEIFSLLKPKIIGIDVWPPERFNYNPGEDANEYDKMVENYCVSQAKDFIKRNITNEDEYIQLQIDTLKYLLYHYAFSDDAEYVRTKEILESINAARADVISEHIFRSQIIAKLREGEVIIGSSNKGLKIPTSVKDLREHIEQINVMISPMAKRVIKARRQIKLLTQGKIDLFLDDRYKLLQKLAEEFEIGNLS